MGYQLIAASPDRAQKLKESIGKHQLNFKLVSDSKMTGAQAFGVAYKVNDKRLVQLKSRGHDLEEASGEKHHLLPVPAVFIIGTDGVIDFQYINPDHRVRLDADILLAAAKANLK